MIFNLKCLKCGFVIRTDYENISDKYIYKKQKCPKCHKFSDFKEITDKGKN